MAPVGGDAPMDRQTRRTFLTAAAGGVAAAAFAAPAVHTARTLRVLGTHVTLQDAIRRRAEADTGLRLKFSPGGSSAVLHKASTQPESFDVYEQWSNSVRVLWQARAIRPLQTHRVAAWGEINGLPKTGRLSDGDMPGAGDRPDRLIYVRPDETLGGGETGRISFLPYVHNADSFGYRPSRLPAGMDSEEESWGWLLDDRLRGRVGIVNAPTIGLFDLALAARAKGLVEFGDIGDLSRAELDRLFEVVLDYRRRGHFRGVWGSVPASVDLMQRGEVVAESMFSPGAFDLRRRGVDCVYAAPKEGYRAWYGVMCLSAAADSWAEGAAYEFMNWWLSGWPGAFIARQGYYISNPERARRQMSAAEWDFWYAGRPAATDLPGTDGRTVVPKGEIRSGGSYGNRMGRVAVWNTVMDTYEYSLRRWSEFLTS